MEPSRINLDGFADWLRSWGAAERTISDRLSMVSAFTRQHPDFPHTATSDVISWLGQPGRSQWTRVTYFSHLASAFSWAAETGQIEVSPLQGQRRPRTPKRTPRPLTSAEVARVLLAASGSVRAWVILALYAGLRAHEVAKFCGEDIDGEVLFVRGKGGKDAFLPVHPEVAAVAARYPRSGFWFPSRSTTGHVGRTHVSARVSELMSSVGIAGGLHRCRHTFATGLLRSGANIRVVQTLMRHDSLATTEGYLEVIEAERRDALRLLSFAA